MRVFSGTVSNLNYNVDRDEISIEYNLSATGNGALAIYQIGPVPPRLHSRGWCFIFCWPKFGRVASLWWISVRWKTWYSQEVIARDIPLEYLNMKNVWEIRSTPQIL